MSAANVTPENEPVEHAGAEDVVPEGRTEAGLLRVFTRVAHREHLHTPQIHNRLAPSHFTRRRPVSTSAALARPTRGTTARKVTWS